MFFFGVTFADPRVDRLFDLARVVLQPDFARKAHITLRGPYNKKPSSKKWLDADIGSVYLSKPGNFFNDNQSTVYLRCSIPFINDFWHKPDYPNGVPHLSIYDGDNRQHAWQVLQVLRSFSWGIKLELSKMKVIDSKERIETNYILNAPRIDAALSEIESHNYSMEKLKSLHWGQRVFLLEKIVKQIHFLSQTSVMMI